MKTLGRGSLAAFLRVALRIALVILYIAIPVSAIGCGVGLLHAHGVTVPMLDIPRPPSPILAWLFTLMVAANLVCAIIIVGRLRRIFATLAAGDAFVPENAGHLRVIAVTVAAGELVRYVLVGATMATLRALEIDPSGGFHRGAINVPLLVWFGVLSLLVLAEVFREGARMRQEQQLTI